MKTIVTVLVCLTLLCVGILSVYFVENEKYKELQGKTIEGLREQNHFLLRRNGHLQIENDTFRKALDSAKIIYK